MTGALSSGKGQGWPTEGRLLLQPVFQGRSRSFFIAGIAVWLCAMGYFWSWWLQPEHIRSWPPYLLLSAVLAWLTLLPAYFIFIFLGARRVVAEKAGIPEGRIAMVVTKAPSEPFAVVRKTLLAMLDQTGVDFDIWLADEDPQPETVKWCREHGIFISSRKGIAAYHRSSWPRRTRCKEGNLAYFYDHYGYDRYDFVAQFDADHVPERTYLQEVMRPFNDPQVGYVSAPSICDANAAGSWSARGRLQAEASMHGSLQAGYNGGWAPLCIGSHYAVRTKALKEIGGLGPELAEDHSTTLMMNAAGWKGVHAIDAIAHGDGPVTFADLVWQEFQWSRSLVTILLQHSPVHVPRLPGRLKFQFLFSQFWYPLFSLFMALMFTLPIIALLSGQNFVNVTYPQFLLHFAPISIVLLGLAFFWRRTGTFRPVNASILGWEAVAFMLLRWPWSLAGSLAALRDHVAGTFVDFRITPKGGKATEHLPFMAVAPYLLLFLATVAAMAFAKDTALVRGFYIFAAVNATIYAGLLVLIMVQHARENNLVLLPRSWGMSLATASMVVGLVAGGDVLVRQSANGVEALTHGITFASFTETKYAVAGAGRGGGNNRITRFSFKWHGFSPKPVLVAEIHEGNDET